MTLATHAVVGATIASIIPDKPVLGFALGFLSHFLLDAIPHWDYKLSTSIEDKENPMNNDMVIDSRFIKDLTKIGFDAGLGLLVTYLLFGINQPVFFLVAILAGAIGGMTPDALQFVYFKFRHEPIISLQKFHIWIHTKTRLAGKPFLGISLQVALVIFVLILKQFFF